MKLSHQKGKDNKIHIYKDDEYALTVDSDYWYTSSWYSVKEISEDDFETMKNDIECRRAFNNAVNLLSYRMHSKKELYQKLLRKHSKQSCDYACDKAEEIGLINDETFAEIYVNELFERKKFGLQRIKSELYLKGISSDLIEKVLSKLDVDGVERIAQLLQTKYQKAITDEKGRKRTFNALVRLGYNYNDISHAMRDAQLLEEFEE